MDLIVQIEKCPFCDYPLTIEGNNNQSYYCAYCTVGETVGDHNFDIFRNIIDYEDDLICLRFIVSQDDVEATVFDGNNQYFFRFKDLIINKKSVLEKYDFILNKMKKLSNFK